VTDLDAGEHQSVLCPTRDKEISRRMQDVLDILSSDFPNPFEYVLCCPFHNGQKGSMSDGTIGSVEDEIIWGIRGTYPKISFLSKGDSQLVFEQVKYPNQPANTRNIII
jgi:hypothetical protein